MKPKVLKALQGSIKKWEDIVLGKIRDQGADNCPLCKMFNKGPGCDGCPVKRYSGDDQCLQTPYHTDWRPACKTARYNHINPARSAYALTDAQVVAARKELDFLRSLLPAKLRIKYPR